MLQYDVIVPYVEQVRFDIGCETALVIIDNFKGQTTQAVIDLLELNDILVCLLPPNNTDALQPIDLSVNKPVKQFLQNCFEQWYAEQIMEQLEENEGTEVEE